MDNTHIFSILIWLRDRNTINTNNKPKEKQKKTEESNEIQEGNNIKGAQLPQMFEFYLCIKMRYPHSPHRTKSIDRARFDSHSVAYLPSMERLQKNDALWRYKYPDRGDYWLKGIMISRTCYDVGVYCKIFLLVWVCVAWWEMVMIVINIKHRSCIKFPISFFLFIKFSYEYFHFFYCVRCVCTAFVRQHTFSLASKQSQDAIRFAPHRFMIWSVG